MKRNEKYKCKYCKEWLSNHHEGYVCPKCGYVELNADNAKKLI